MIEKFQQRFIEEARDNCDRAEQRLLELEQDYGRQDHIDEIFRIMHSLKGSGGMFGFGLLSEFTHDLESLYQLIREGTLPLNPALISFTLRCVDVLKNLLVLVVPDDLKKLVDQMKGEIRQFMDEQPNAGSAAFSSLTPGCVSDPAAEKKSYYIFFEPGEHVFRNGTNPLYLIDELNTLGDCRVEADMKKVPLLDLLQVETCYTAWRAILTTDVPRTEIEDVFLFVRDHSRIDIYEIPDPAILSDEEKIRIFFNEDPGSVPERIKEMAEVKVPVSPPVAVPNTSPDDAVWSTVRVDSGRIDEYMNLVSEMITAQSRLYALAETRNDKDIELLAERFNKLIRQLRDNALDMSLVPIYQVATRFRRLVRDLSAELKKEVNLVLEGWDTEVDKNVIEKLIDPMIHLVRNCLDHGIETPAERTARNKPPAGTISITAGYEGNDVTIRIEDDGQGLDFEKIRTKAVDKGLIAQDDPESEERLIQVIFKPGFTTSDHLTDVSGRGVGLDAARKMIHDLRGAIFVGTRQGQGTCFTIRVPLTLSIIDGLMVRIRDDFYILPVAGIEKIYPYVRKKEDNSPFRMEVFEGKQIPYLNLREEFYGDAGSLSRQYLIAVSGKSHIFGLVVDDVLREYQAVVKPVAKMTGNEDIFMGATILGDGNVALVLDTNTIIQKFSQ